MPAAHRHRRLALAAAATALLLTTPTLTACSTVDTALDCARTADTVADSVTRLQQAVDNAGNAPLDADDDLRAIDDNLADLKDRTDNADLGKAADHLADAVTAVRTSIDNGDRTPDLGPATEAAGEITKVCTP
ncbi:hypothetical protein AB0J21_27150 [Streptomyces sp. NPDC049954]|uniref:hypothetical protein n=1 Tax=Streptomyces sp. NPDC049954 TaxID=3155779 RepID=UPI00342C0963